MSEPAAPAPETEAKQSRGLGSYVVWGFVVVVVYVLSSGPMLRLVLKNKLNNKVMIIYEPLGRFYQYTPLRKPFGMYLHLWCPEDINTEGKFIKD